jgi:anti-sigma B factor antagonist
MSETPSFDVHVERLPEDHVVVSVVGELDFGSAQQLHQTLFDVILSALVVLDLGACDFCDSSGLRTILTWAQQARLAGNVFRVAGVGPAVSRVIELADVASYLNLFPDVQAALRG